MPQRQWKPHLARRRAPFNVRWVPRSKAISFKRITTKNGEKNLREYSSTERASERRSSGIHRRALTKCVYYRTVAAWHGDRELDRTRGRVLYALLGRLRRWVRRFLSLLSGARRSNPCGHVFASFGQQGGRGGRMGYFSTCTVFGIFGRGTRVASGGHECSPKAEIEM